MVSRDGLLHAGLVLMEHLAAELQLPAAYPFPVKRVDVIETHISWVFLAGPFAYKVKKPVNLGFVDYSTLKRRRHFCEDEVQLNARLAPATYLGVVPICRWAGTLRFEGAGEVEEYAVKMRRLSPERMLDALLRAGAIDVPEIQRLAGVISRFHASARTGPGVDEFGSLHTVSQNWQECFDQVRPFVGRWLTHAQFARLYSFFHDERQRLAPTFLNRMASGRIRDCHGDLRCESIWLAPDGGFQIFDCIEFNERLRYGDVASEVAFLASELDWRGRPDLAWSWVEAYVAASGDDGLREVLPFYKCYRALVRGKVEAMTQQRVSDIEERYRHAVAAREHFALAETYTLRYAPTLFLTCGMVGSGKTTLARGLASMLGLPLASSDVVRKQLAGLNPFEHRVAEVDSGLYSPEWTRRTYDELYRQAGALLARGSSVILDATFASAAERDRAMQVARRAGAGCLVLAIEVAGEEIRRRLRLRREGGVTESDAGPELFERVRSRFESPDGIQAAQVVQVPGTGSIQHTVAACLSAIHHRLPQAHPALRSA